MKKKYAPKLVSQKDIKQVDELTVAIVRELNALLQKAEREQLITIANILKDARESIAWWAAHDDYQESPTDRLIHHLTMDRQIPVSVL